MGYHFSSKTLMIASAPDAPTTAGDEIAIVHPRYGTEETGLRIDGVDYRVALFAGDEPGEAFLELDGQRERVWLATKDDVHFIHLRGRTHRVVAVNALERAREEAAPGESTDLVRAPMPGVVVEVGVAPGDSVEPGDLLMTIESMKLETALRAMRAGIIAEIPLDAGAAFDQGTVLVRLETEAGETNGDPLAHTEENNR